MPGSTSTPEVISAALDEFNEGHRDALSAWTGPGALHPQALLGCSVSRTCSARRPVPVVAGSGKLSLVEIREVGEHRAVCNLVTENGIRLVGLYAVQDGCITAACHYLSDVDMLAEIGVLPLTGLPDATHEHHAPAGVAAKCSDPRASLSIGDSLLDARVAHRQRRLRLAIRALDLRVEALSDSGEPTPRALTQAIRGFQQELDDTQHSQPQPTTHNAHRPQTIAEPEPDGPSCWSALGTDDVYAGTTLVGSCAGCRSLLFAHDPHEWANEHTRELCLPYDDGAALYCGACWSSSPSTSLDCVG